MLGYPIRQPFNVISIVLQKWDWIPHFYARQNIYAIARICHANSVCLSVTGVLCVKTAERIIEILLLSDRPIILVFRHEGLSHNSDGFIPERQIHGVAIFDQYAAISRER